MTLLRTILLIIGVLAVFPALLLGAAGVLAFAGILADVGPDENRKIGLQAFSYAAVFTFISIAFIAASLFAGLRQQPKQETRSD